MEEFTVYCPCCGKKLIIKNPGGAESPEVSFDTREPEHNSAGYKGKLEFGDFGESTAYVHET